MTRGYLNAPEELAPEIHGLAWSTLRHRSAWTREKRREPPRALSSLDGQAHDISIILKALDVVHQALHQEETAAILVLEVLGRCWVGSLFLEIEPRSFIDNVEDDSIRAYNGADTNLFVFRFAIAAKNRVRYRFSERDTDVERSLMGVQMKLATLSRRELHYAIDVAYVARYSDIQSDV